jgi:ABC-2 type transport system permease protein
VSHATSAATTTIATFRREWTVTLRAYRWSFLLGSLLTGVFTVALAYLVYHAVGAGGVARSFAMYAGTTNYVSYVALGMIGFIFAQSMMFAVSRALIIERRQGTLVSLILTPSHRLGYLAGIAAQAILASMAEVAILLVALIPFGLGLHRVSLVALAEAAPLALLAMFGMSLVLGAVMLATADTYISQNTLFLAMAVLCGFTFPPQYLPDPLPLLSQALPVTHAMELLRLALPQGRSAATAPPGQLLSCLLLGALYTVLGIRAMSWAERRALEGTS